jgi:hypothetical protein
VTGDSTVNILGAKMGENIALPGKESSSGKAKITLGADQGTSYEDYAKAFALGEDFKIHVGGRVVSEARTLLLTSTQDSELQKESNVSEQMEDNIGPAVPMGLLIQSNETHSFELVAPANDTTNTVNILGAIARGSQSNNTSDSSLTVDNGWAVNTYDPVSDLENITVANGGTLNLLNGASNISKITLNDGTLRIGNSPQGEFDRAISQIAEKLEYTDPVTKTVYKGSEGNIEIDASNYPWKGSGGDANKSTLTINAGESVEVLRRFQKVPSLYVSEDGVLQLNKGGQMIVNLTNSAGCLGTDGSVIGLQGSGRMELNQSFTINLIAKEENIKNINAVLLQCRDGVPKFDGINGKKFTRANGTYQAFSEEMCIIQFHGKRLNIAEKFGTSLLLDCNSGEMRIDSTMRYIPFAPRVDNVLVCAPGSKILFADWYVKDGVESGAKIIDAENGTADQPLVGSGGLCGISVSNDVAIIIKGESEVAEGRSEPTEFHFSDRPGFRAEILDASSKPVYAHVYAKNTENDQTAIGIKLDQGANVTISADAEDSRTKFPPVIAAYSNVIEEHYASGAAVGLWATDTDGGTITFASTASMSLHGKSSAGSSGGDNLTYSAAAGFGTAVGRVGSDSEKIATSGVMATFGVNNTLSAISSTSGGTGYSAAAVIGAAVGYSGGTVIAASDIAATFGDGNTLSANSSASERGAFAAAVIGAAMGYDNENSVISASGIAAIFGDGNTLSAISSTSGGTGYSAAAVIGVAVGYSGGTVISTSGIAATFSDGNTLSANSSASGVISGSVATVLGAAVGRSNHAATTVSGIAATFGANNTLSADSSAGGYSYSAAAVLGAAIGHGNENSAIAANDIIATFGDGNTLSANSSASGKSGRSAATVFGVAAGNGGSVAASGIAATFGDGNTLSANSSAGESSRSAVAVIGAAAGNAEGNSVITASDITATFGVNNTLSAISSAGVNGRSAAAALGAAVGIGSASASGITANFNGRQVVSALAYGTASTKVNTFGTDKTDMRRYAEGDADMPEETSVGELVPGAYGWRVGIFAAGTDIVEDGRTVAHAVTGDSTVNILGAKMGKNVTLPGQESSSGKAKITPGADQGTNSKEYARVFALGEDFKIHVGGRVIQANEIHSLEPVVPANGTANTVNILGAIARGSQSASVDDSSLTVDNGWTVNTYGPVEELANITVANGSTLNLLNGASDIGAITLSGGTLRIGNSPEGEFDRAIFQVAEKLEYTDPATKTV